MKAEEIAGTISQALQDDGKIAVLSGGAVVSIYSDNQYESSDLDFISQHSLESLEPTMRRLGFRRTPGRYFDHPDTDYFVEFPPGPVQIGKRVIQEWERLVCPSGSILILTPTQCVMDRLASFFHWNDRQCLDQAVMVGTRHEIDLCEVQNWSLEEGHTEKFQEFKEILMKEKGKY
jgi:hypothetical protein